MNGIVGEQQRYEVLEPVSSGGYGVVTRALDKETRQPVALKFLRRGGKITKYVEREIEIHRRLRHPHIIAMKQVFLTEEHLVIVMEYAEGGDLSKHIGRRRALPEEDSRWLFRQILFAIDYCHKMGVCNRDVKLENMLLMDTGPRPLVKLADFGFSKDENCHSAPGSRVGSPAYLAPEVITNSQGQPYDARKLDAWSCGVVLFAMVTGSLPFRRSEDAQQPEQKQVQAMMQRIIGLRYRFPEGRPLSDTCKDLISKLLVADPVERLSVHEALQHPWCSQGMLPQMMDYNAAIVATSLANPPSPQELEKIKSLLAEAVQPVVPLREEQTGLGAGAHSAELDLAELEDALNGQDHIGIDFIQC